jgi:transcriptional regulator of heat shock response
MVKFLDSVEREREILNLVINSYITESKPISSSYLCDRYDLPCSSATVRNIMVALEKKGFLSHIHTSSGRVPTKAAFKYYAQRFKDADNVEDFPVSFDFFHETDIDSEEIINQMINMLAEVSGYTSLVAVSGRGEKVFLSGRRFILEQPEFEDIKQLRNLFYALEVKMSHFQELLFKYLDEDVSIIIGEDIGFEEISECALVVSGLKEISCAFALLGPIRMDYARAVGCLSSIKHQLKDIMGELL